MLLLIYYGSSLKVVAEVKVKSQIYNRYMFILQIYFYPCKKPLARKQIFNKLIKITFKTVTSVNIFKCIYT